MEIRVVGKIKIDVPTKKVHHTYKPVEKKQDLRKLNIHFFRGKKGDVIGRTDSGKIAFVQNGLTHVVGENEDWLCQVHTEDNSKMVVIPLEMTVSSIENDSRVKEMAQGLLTKEWNKTIGRPFSPVSGRVVHVKKFNR